MTSSTQSLRRPLFLLTGLGFAAGAWATYLWWQLLRARAGFDPVCLGGNDGCGALWDGGFASTIHAATGLPVAAWGVVWSIAAAALPLRALGRLEKDAKATSPVAWTGLAGFLGIAGLLIVSFAEGGFCTSCAVTYLLTLIYGVIALITMGNPSLDGGGLPTFVTAVAASWLLLLYPGLRTPKNLEQAGQQALQAPENSHQADGHEGHDHNQELAPLPENLDEHPLAIKTWPLEAADQEQKLRAFLADLDPQVKNALVELLSRFRQAPYFPAPEPRAAVGSADATTRITDFTDTQCGHCAQLFMSLRFLHGLFPEGAFSIDSRHFPLDGNCNPHLEVRGPEQVRCMAAKARICMEPLSGREAYEEQLYRNQLDLTREQVLDFAAQHTDRASFEACVASPETTAALNQDIAQAWLYEPTGTPLVLVNGHQSSPYGPFLYMMILAGGNIDHPVLTELASGI